METSPPSSTSPSSSARVHAISFPPGLLATSPLLLLRFYSPTSQIPTLDLLADAVAILHHLPPLLSLSLFSHLRRRNRSPPRIGRHLPDFPSTAVASTFSTSLATVTSLMPLSSLWMTASSSTCSRRMASSFSFSFSFAFSSVMPSLDPHRRPIFLFSWSTHSLPDLRPLPLQTPPSSNATNRCLFPFFSGKQEPVPLPSPHRHPLLPLQQLPSTAMASDEANKPHRQQQPHPGQTPLSQPFGSAIFSQPRPSSVNLF